MLQRCLGEANDSLALEVGRLKTEAVPCRPASRQASSQNPLSDDRAQILRGVTLIGIPAEMNVDKSLLRCRMSSIVSADARW